MSSLPQKLRRFPRLFDCLNGVARRLGRRTELFKQLDRALPAKSPFSFLQIGANDGISHDPFREFMIRRNARGIAVEPVPEFFRAMSENYQAYPNVFPENCAVGYPAGCLPFYAYTDSFLKAKNGSKELAGLASFSREKLMQCLCPDDESDTCIQEIIISVQTVEDVMLKHDFERFDCLFMDCEGHEENILTQLDYEVVQPHLIVFEHTYYGERAEQIETHLSAQGFSFTRLIYDTVAIR